MELEQMLKNVGWQITDRGIDEATARQVVEVARRLHVADVATAVFADTQAPYVARCRAFGIVAGAIRRAVENRPAFTLAA
jgi:hypothetical protein